MAKVFCIFEENHGFIGVATTPNATAHWLIDSGWVNKKSDWYDEKSRDFILLEEVVPDSYMGEWENWFMTRLRKTEQNFWKISASKWSRKNWREKSKICFRAEGLGEKSPKFF